MPSTAASTNDNHDCNTYSTGLHSTTTATAHEYQPSTQNSGTSNNHSNRTISELTNAVTTTYVTPQERDEPLPPLNSTYIKATTADTLKTNPQLKQWSSGKLSTVQLEEFAKTHIPTSVQTQLNQTFGKDNLSQSFYAEKYFRHVLLPVLKSGFLSRQTTKYLERASFRARQLQQLRKRYASVDFRPLQGFQNDWESTTTIREDWKTMTSACVLHFNGDIATVVRWIGGSHTNNHLNVEATLTKLEPIIDPITWNDLSRILRSGAPALCNAEASEENFQAYLKYGNHTSVRDNQDVFEQTIVKQSKRGLLTIIMDPDLIHFALNAHVSPQGLVDVLHARRKPRPLSDSSFRPYPGAFAINDWTNKVNEPKLHFADSFNQFCIWHWNLAISYPKHDRHTGDDDVQCAFPRAKYNPNLVAMHSAVSNNTLIMNTGLTFGDNTSPSNWEPIARARQQLAKKLWHDDDIIEQAAKYLPPISFEPPATDEQRAKFAVAIPDSLNKGVYEEKTNRRISPRYNHHVDDNMYGDISENMERAAAASVISLYEIVGYPDGRIPEPLSWEKFTSTYGHIRRIVGWDFNTRTLSFSLPSDKRTAITALVAEWLSKTQFTILEAAELHGKLADASRANRKGRTMFFAFQNAIRRSLQTRFAQVRGFYKRKNKIQHFKAQLPKHLHSRVNSLIARDMAALLWATSTKTTVTVPVQHELRQIHAYMSNCTVPWEMKIAHVIPRDP